MDMLAKTINVLRVLALSASLLPIISTAEIVHLDGLNGAVQLDEQTPQRGMHKNAVLKRYGDPISRHDAVGSPPISSWDYPSFTVYFEHDHVIHSVLH